VDGAAGCAFLVRDGESEPGQGAIGHPRVQVEEGAGVDVFLMREPQLQSRGGYCPVAAETYRVTGSIVIPPVLEVKAVRGELKNFGGHRWPAFTR
jgi:hypothetical protein